MSKLRTVFLGALLLALASESEAARILFEATSPYHHIRVVDANGMRTLYFNDATESRMSIWNPLRGHFEYTEYFHMPWLWNPQATNLLTIGLGGASIQRSFEHYYTNAHIDTVEIDPVVAKVAKEYFHYKPSARQGLHVMDGRVFLRRSAKKYDVIILDAYTASRYGSSIPPHLVTKEFFKLAQAHLTTNGVLAYNVITTLRAWNTDMVGAMYRTLKVVFPQVYWFRARTSLNVVLVATQSPARLNLAALRTKARELTRTRRITLPTFWQRLYNFQPNPPANYLRCPILTDDFAPVERLMH